MREFTNLFSLHVIICMTWIAIITFSSAQVYPWVFVLLFFLIAVGIYILARLFSWRVFLLYFFAVVVCLFRVWQLLDTTHVPVHKSTVDAIVVVKDYSQAKKKFVQVPVEIVRLREGTQYRIAKRSRFYLQFSDMSLEFAPGMMVQVKAQVTRPEAYARTSESYLRYLKSKKIHGILKTSSFRIISQEIAYYQAWVWLAHLRQAITKKLNEAFSEEASSFIMSILFGDRSQLSEEIASYYRRAGMVHLLAISGFHISFIGSGICLLLSFFTPREVARILSVILVFLYLLLLNNSPSAIRASISYAIQVIALLTNTKMGKLTPLALTCCIMLFINPFVLYDLGFILSFMATLGILIFNGRVDKLLAGKMPAFFRSTLSVSITASLATFLIQASSFGYITWFSLISGFALIPLFSFVFAGILLLVPLYIITGASLIAWCIEIIIMIYNRFIYFGSLVSPLTIEYASPDWAYLFVIMLTMTTYLLPFLCNRGKRFVLWLMLKHKSLTLIKLDNS